MKYIYYNTETQTIIRERNEPYLIYGKQGKLPQDVVELQRVESDKPSYNELIEKLVLSYQVDLQNKEYRHLWEKVSKTIYEIKTDDWKYMEFGLRVVAPLILANQYPQIEVWFRLNELPIEICDDIAYLYCNAIQPFHQELIDAHQEVHVESLADINDN